MIARRLYFATVLLIIFPVIMAAVVAPFKPHPWQVAPWRDTSPIMLLTGSAGGGKSQIAAEKVHGFLKRYPGAFGVMTRKSRESMTNSTVLFFEHSVVGADPHVKHYPSKHRFEYVNGSILAYGGMLDEKQREQMRSIGHRGGVDIWWMEEANKNTEDDLNEALGRMRGKAAPWRQLILTTNPDHPKHWINTRLIIGRGATVYYSTAHDNPSNPPEYLQFLDLLTGVLRLRLRDGKWAQAEGAVYDEWNPMIHVVEPFPIPAWWRRFRSIDFGYTNPFSCSWYALDHDGRLYLYRQIYMTGRLVEDHARDIVRLSEGEHIEATVADHDAEDRATLERYGIPTIPAVKEMSTGIQALKLRLRVAGDGKPRFFVVSGALLESDQSLARRKRPTCTEEEFPAYVWPVDKAGKFSREAPVDEFNHGLDEARYLVVHVDGSVPPPTQVATVAKRQPAPASSSLSGLPGLGLIAPSSRTGKRGRR